MKLPAASYIDIKNNDSKTQTYWELKYNQTTLSTKEAINITEDKIRQAVQYQMVSDVPLGAFLSGGVDSSVIVAMMSQSLPITQLKLFLLFGTSKVKLLMRESIHRWFRSCIKRIIMNFSWSPILKRCLIL